MHGLLVWLLRGSVPLSLNSRTVSGVGIAEQANDYNVLPFVDEDDYGMYADGTGTVADPFENFDPQPMPHPAADALTDVMPDIPDNSGLGPIADRL